MAVLALIDRNGVRNSRANRAFQCGFNLFQRQLGYGLNQAIVHDVGDVDDEVRDVVEDVNKDVEVEVSDDETDFDVEVGVPVGEKEVQAEVSVDDKNFNKKFEVAITDVANNVKKSSKLFDYILTIYKKII